VSDREHQRMSRQAGLVVGMASSVTGGKTRDMATVLQLALLEVIEQGTGRSTADACRYIIELNQGFLEALEEEAIELNEKLSDAVFDVSAQLDAITAKVNGEEA